uniref:RNA-directed RNA polymerase n=1 Tax=Zeugodacus cucurbitae noda-like virus 2 TaxID=3159466 RepID=A0AAU7L0R5_9VIRU
MRVQLHRVIMRKLLSLSWSIVCDRKWMIAGCIGGVAIYCVVKRNRAVASYICSRTKSNVNQGFRQGFNTEFVFTESAPRDTAHSHPLSSRLRTDGERSIDNLIYIKGFQPYSVSTSARDGEGQRLVYSAKDLDLPFQNDRVTDQHVVRMIDVDYYADMEYWLWQGRPIILYTFVPEIVGGPVVEGVFSIDQDVATVVYDGGGRYVHRMWDYNVDHFIVPGFWKSLMVKVDQVRVPGDTNRRIVCLTPTTWYWSMFNWLFDAKRLMRRKFTYGDANICTFHQTIEQVTKCMVSIALRDTPTNVSMEYSCFVGICKRLSQSKHPNVTDVERYLHNDKVPNAAVLAPIIYEAFEGGWYKSLAYRHVDQVVGVGVSRTAPHFQASGPLVTEEGSEIGVAVWEPILTNAAIFPRESFNNDVQAIEGRVNNIRNNVNPSSKYHMYRREFIEAFGRGQCVPVSMSDVIERQDKPLQKIRCEKNKMWCRCQKFHVKAFMKKESYMKVTDPRNISTCTPSHTMTLSTYTYAAKEIFKRYDWFVPGRTPVEIADQVRSLVSGYGEVLSCDYSRLDGTISAFLRGVESGVYLRLFPQKYKKDLEKLLKDESNCRATTATGKPYEPGSSRLSGSPLTTDGNTLIVAFVAYCAFRTAGVLEEGEIDHIRSLVYGDDKLVVGVAPRILEKVARDLGLTLKCEVTRSGEPVEFLARVFVNPWITSTSMQNPVRALGKLHLSHVRNVDARIVAHNKARGYLVTDRLTPLIREYCLNVTTQTRDVTELHLNRVELMADTPYWSAYENDSWPQDICDVELMESEIAKRLRVTVADVREKCRQLDNNEWTAFDYQLPEPTIGAVVTGSGDPIVIVPERPASEPGASGRRRQAQARN